MKIVINCNYQKANYLFNWMLNDVKENTKDIDFDIEYYINMPKKEFINNNIINIFIHYINTNTGNIKVEIPNHYGLAKIGNTLVNNLKENQEYLRYLLGTNAVIEDKVLRDELYIDISLPRNKVFHQQGVNFVKELGISIMNLVKPFGYNYTPTAYNAAYELLELEEEPKESNQLPINIETPWNKNQQEHTKVSEEPVQTLTVEEELDNLMDEFEEVNLPDISQMRHLTPEEQKSYNETIDNMSEDTGVKLFDYINEDPVKEEPQKHNNPQKSVFNNNKNKNKKKNKNK